MKEIICIYDKAHNGVICSAQSYSHAHAILSGLINGGMRSVYYRDPAEFTLNLNNPEEHYKVIQNVLKPTGSLNNSNDQHTISSETNDVLKLRQEFVFVKLPKEFATEDWSNYRKLMIEKSYCLEYWEFRCRKITARLEEYYGSYFESFINTELLQCQPNSNYYTRAIHEYAAIQDIPVDTAYQELNIKNQHKGLSYTRNYAIYLNGVRALNKETTIEGLKKTLHSFLTSELHTSFGPRVE